MADTRFWMADKKERCWIEDKTKKANIQMQNFGKKAKFCMWRGFAALRDRGILVRES